MKAACIIATFSLLCLIVGCSRQAQPTQTAAPQNNQAQPQSQPSLAKSDRGTPAEAKAMLQQAVDHYNSVGRKQALADFNGKKPPFADRDLYVVCIGSDFRIIANGGFPQYVGQSADLLKDAAGKPVGKAICETANKGEGSVQFRWINPVSGKTEPKIFFSQKVGDDVCGVGAYNPQ